ncbi:MAG TPA: serine/threonine-protein kinase [Lacipirellula sp.]
MQLSRIGPIALEEPLGGSPDSNVLRGVHLERNKAMAVKLLPRHMVNRPMGGDYFAADVKTLQKLVHPRIARVYGGAMDNGQPYLAMELVDGESLRCLLDRRGRLSWETTADIAESICEALVYAHEAGLAHQRLTPSRVMLTPAGGVKLLGFDCQMTDKDEVVGLRSPMTVANYLAPEAFRGKPSAALPTADMFSLGVIIYECLTGQLPWKANTPSELVQARRAGPAPRVSATVLECPVWLDVLVAKLLETKRGIRLATADATRRAIIDARRKVAAGMSAAQQAYSGRQGTLTVDTDRREIAQIRRKRVSHEQDNSPFYERVWFLALCLLVVIGVGAWFMRPKSEEALFAAAAPLMASDKPVDWNRAKDQYLNELLERFPDTKYKPQIDEFEDRYAVHRARERIKNLERFGRSPKSDAERLYAEGWRLERFDDPLSAWRKYEEATQAADKEDRDQRAYATLAREGINRIKSQAAAQLEVDQVVQAKLDEAAALASQGKELQARLVLDRIISLYGTNSKVRPLVQEARVRINQLDVN